MREKIKTGIAVLIILILLPYVAVVFRTGSMTGMQNEDKKLEAYVMGILPGQMSAAYEEEALKAQAVVIRTNLLKKSGEFYGKEKLKEAAASIEEEDLKELGFTYYGPEQLEGLWGYEVLELYEARIRQAVEETAGQILEFDEKPVDLPYHAVSAGRTRDGSVLGSAYSYLEAVECPGDLRAVDYLKIQTFNIEGTPEILSRDAAGYVMEIRLGGETMAGEEFRSRYQLSSSCFMLEETEEGLRIITKGLGHGLGLSLYQANLLALEGRTYLEILTHFYKNVECISVS